MDTPRLSQSTQSVPAPPLGPRRPSYTLARYPTAPPMRRPNAKEQIPVDKIADVLRNPGHYSEQYPDTLPLTRKLYQQLGAKKLAKPTHGIVSHEPAQAVEPLRRPMQGLHFQHLDVNREDTVHPGHNSVRRDIQRHQGRPQPRSPAGEGETSIRSSPNSTLSIVEVDIVYDDEPFQPTHDGARPTHDRVQPTHNQIGVRALTWMDILERGEWPLPCGVEMGDLFVVSY